MKNSNSRKDLLTQYKEREKTGGVYLIRNTINNKILLDDTLDLQGSKNRFEFAQKTETCVYLKLQADWAEQTGSIFVFQVLEEYKKGETQTIAEFKTDLSLLKALWLEKLANENFY